MKEYTDPKMKISIFRNEAETAAAVSSDPTQNGYVPGLDNVADADKAQVRLRDMQQIVKFTF